MKPRPTYLTIKKLALELNMNNLSRIIRKWKHHPQNPTPEPDAWYIITDEPLPLWHTKRRQEWHNWKERRDVIVAELHAQERANALARKALEEHE